MLDKVNPSRSTLETITPELAAKWLRGNANNRHPSISLVKEYARAMGEHRWRVNGETIKISTQGRLLDGQHRLMACVESNCEFRSYVVYGADDDVFDTIDIGKKRSAGDILGIEGCKNATATAAAIRWLVLFRSGNFQMSSTKVANDEVRLLLANEPGIEHSVSQSLVAGAIVAPGLCGALHYLFSMKDVDAADLFFLDLGTGSNLVPGDPLLVLREKLIRDRMNKARLQKEEIASLCIRAWNHRRQKNGGTVLLKGSNLNRDGSRSFPEIA